MCFNALKIRFGIGNYKLLFVVFAFLLESCTAPADNRVQSKTADSKTRPNVVLIMTDDQGYGDLGFTGNKDIQTPNLDALKDESIFLSNFHVSPACSPTRASLITEKFTLITGVYDTFNGGSLMSGDEVTIAEIFKIYGYQTGIFGKWHLGLYCPLHPSSQGFNNLLIRRGGGIGQPADPDNYPRFDSSYFNPKLYRNNELMSTTGYCSDVFTKAAMNFIGTDKEAPFFAYLSFNAPHTPLQVPEEWCELYRNLNFQADSSRMILTMSESEKEKSRRIYAMVSNIDYNIGRLVEKFKQECVWKNTIFVFLSDNVSISRRYNAGLRALKATTYQGGVKSPCIIHYPALETTGDAVDNLTAHIDLLPTLSELCRLNLPEDIDGKSIAPLFRGENDKSFEQRSLYEQWGRMYPERYKNMSVRKGKHKLIGQVNYQAEIKIFELYDLDKDPYEQYNLVSELPEVARQLKDELDQWYEKEVIQNRHYRKVYMALNPKKKEKLILTRNDLKGTPEIWNNDFQYGYWDIDVEEVGNYDIELRFKSIAQKTGRLYVKQQPLQYFLENSDANARLLTMKNVYLNQGKAPLEIFYKTG